MQPNVVNLTQCIVMHYNVPMYTSPLPQQWVSLCR